LPSPGPLGTWWVSPRAAPGASLTRAGDEARTQVPHLLRCGGNAARDLAPGLGRVAAPVTPLRLLAFSFLFLPCLLPPWLFALPSSPPPPPSFSLPGLVERRAPLPGSQRRRVERGGVGEGLFGGGGRSSARRGSNGAGSRASSSTSRVESGNGAGEGGGWGTNGSCLPGQVPLVPQS
jgi:hypothetical protein